MKRNLWRHRGKWLAFGVLSLIALVALFGFSGPFRHHGHHPERFEKKMDKIAEHVADELELRSDQRPAFDALTDGIKERVRARLGQMRQTATQVRDEFAAETVDPDRVADLLKEHARNRMTVEEIEGLIDEITTFYKTLDSDQQAKLKEEVSDRLEHHF